MRFVKKLQGKYEVSALDSNTKKTLLTKLEQIQYDLKGCLDLLDKGEVQTKINQASKILETVKNEL